jgi:hypothetical protein
MPTKNLSTTAQLNKIIEFRQTAYEQMLLKQFELMDALLSTNSKPGCFAELMSISRFSAKVE